MDMSKLSYDTQDIAYKFMLPTFILYHCRCCYRLFRQSGD